MEMKTLWANRSATERLKTLEEERARLSALAAEEAEADRIATEHAAALQKAKSDREAREAAERARKAAVIKQASSFVLPQVVTTPHAKNYDGLPLLNIDHITKQYDATIIGAAPAYCLTNYGQLIASDKVISQNIWCIESQLLPESHIARAASLYAAWLANRVDSLAAKAAAIASHREISGASVLYVAKLPTIRVVKDSEYKELSRIICEFGDFCVMAMGE